jgi:hypothetical protein
MVKIKMFIRNKCLIVSLCPLLCFELFKLPSFDSNIIAVRFHRNKFGFSDDDIP